MARSPDVALALVALSLTGAAAVRWTRPLPETSTLGSSLAAPPSVAPALDAEAMDAAADAAIDRDPFRLSRRPSDVPYVRAVPAGAIATAPLFRPTLVLKGIVGGPPWQAVIDGIPGVPPGTVVKAGSTFDKLTVRSITRDSVILQGPDTTWRLTILRGAP